MLDIRCMHLTTLAFMHCYILQSLEPAFFPMSALVTHVVGILQISEAIYILDAATDFQLYACLPVKFSNTAYVAHV